MDLPPELRKLPLSSLDILRAMGRSGTTAADENQLAEISAMSTRGARKAIRGLITKNYLEMDGVRVYHLTDKGQQAIVDVAAYDATRGDEPDNADEFAISTELVAVIPHPIAAPRTELKVGLTDAVDADDETLLVIRFQPTGGVVEPAEVTLDLKPDELPDPVTVNISPDAGQSMVRIRVEALQMIGDTDVYPAGGMFFDVPVAAAPGQLQAWYGALALQ